VFGIIGFLGYAYHQVVHVVVPNAYAVWWTADLVIEHMERNGGAWPKSWKELEATAEVAHKGTVSTNIDGHVIAEFRPRETIENLQQRVEINWNADPSVLAKATRPTEGPPFRVIRLHNGKSTHYEGREPNEMILRYLESKRGTVTQTAPVTAP
jgi:hypothetical protein